MQTYVLPLVDISLLNSPNLDERKQVAEALDQACKEVGFLYLKGNQFKSELFKNLVEMSKAYFAQDLDKKMLNYIGQSTNHSGYVPIGEEQFANSDPKSKTYDLKEAYDVNYDYQGNIQNCPLLGKTQWPDLPQFKQQVSAYYQHLKAIGDQVFSAFALALGVDEHYFIPFRDHAPSQLRLIHYPHNPEALDAEGIGAHTDYEFFTLLLPTAPGLQVLNKESEWIDIPLIENTLVMNIGDMMQILSNGKYLATKHRVKKVQEERYSFPMFCACNYDYVIQPLTQDEPHHYSPLMSGEHLFNQTAQTFKYLKDRIACGELTLKNAVPLSSFGLKEKDALS